MGRGAMVAQRTLDPFILVRIRAPQPDRPTWIFSVFDEDSNQLIATCRLIVPDEDDNEDWESRSHPTGLVCLKRHAVLVVF
jgi:hypothetical protein